MNKLGVLKNKINAFTLTEVLIAVGIVGVIASLVLPKIVNDYQTKTLNAGYSREVQTIMDSLNGLAVNENKSDFFSTMMYVDALPEETSDEVYENNAAQYMKKYLRVSQMCEKPEDCFAEKYYQYEAGKKREEYKPDYKGACAIFKNGVSLCITPQVGADSIHGVIDLNGKKGPNVLSRDLRPFLITSKTRISRNQDTAAVIKLDWVNLEPEEEETTPPPPTDPCETEPNGVACCQTKTITVSSDPCCTHKEIKDSVEKCREEKEAIISIKQTKPGNLSNVYQVFLYDNSSSKWTSMKAPTNITVRWFSDGNTVALSYWASCTIPAGGDRCTYTPPWLIGFWMLPAASRGSATPNIEGYKYKFYY